MISSQFVSIETDIASPICARKDLAGGTDGKDYNYSSIIMTRGWEGREGMGREEERRGKWER